MRRRKLERRLEDISRILEDIESGHPRHKILTEPDAPEAKLCFQINRIVEGYQNRIQELERKEQLRKQLLTSLSHDVRTPLASLMGYLEAVDDSLIPREKQADYIHVARGKAGDLKLLVDELFDWFRLESGERRFFFQELDFNELVRQIVGEMIPIIERNQMEYRISIPEQPCRIFLDEEGIRRIARNLIQNVCQHSGAAEIRISTVEEKDTALLRIEDNGRGIAEADLPRIFERMYKCDPARSQRSGGLGLAIVKSLVEAHGGTVEAESQQGEGCRFTVRLPKERVCPAEEEGL